jgi:signal transduction histidine kinase
MNAAVITDEILSEFQRCDTGTAPESLPKIRPVLKAALERALAGLAASREEERRWIARELHDRAAHGMAVTLQRLDRHKRLVSVDADQSELVFDAAIESLHESLRTIQEISTGLRHTKAENRNIRVAIQAYLRDNVPCGIRAVLAVSGAPEALPARVSDELHLIVREACRNALRHATATRVLLAIAITDYTVTATISDDGCGFDVAAAGRGRGGGLPSMAERAGLLGGALTVHSVIGRGTTVTVRIPLRGDGSR